MELTANLEEIKDAKNRTRDEIVGFIHMISEMDKMIAKLKTENAALRERLEKYKISFKKVYMDFFSKLNRDKDFRKRFDNVTLGCQLTMFEDALDKAEARLAELKGEDE